MDQARLPHYICGRRALGTRLLLSAQSEDVVSCSHIALRALPAALVLQSSLAGCGDHETRPATPVNTPPTPCFIAAPSIGTTETEFSFDAGCSRDLQDRWMGPGARRNERRSPIAASSTTTPSTRREGTLSSSSPTGAGGSSSTRPGSRTVGPSPLRCWCRFLRG